jgi:hypothetical protein
VLLLFAPFENSKWPPAIIIVHWTICKKTVSPFKKKLSVLIEQKIIIRWQNFQIKFTIPTDQLVKLTTH